MCVWSHGNKFPTDCGRINSWARHRDHLLPSEEKDAVSVQQLPVVFGLPTVQAALLQLGVSCNTQLGKQERERQESELVWVSMDVTGWERLTREMRLLAVHNCLALLFMPQPQDNISTTYNQRRKKTCEPDPQACVKLNPSPFPVAIEKAMTASHQLQWFFALILC